MFSRDRLITGIISRKLDENWPNLVVNLLFANGWNTRKPVVCLSAVRFISLFLSNGLSVFLSFRFIWVYLSGSSVCLSVCLSASLSVCLSICLSVCLCLSASLSVCLFLSVCLSVCQPLSLFVSLSICLSIYLSVCPFALFLCISVLCKQLSVSFSKY